MFHSAQGQCSLTRLGLSLTPHDAHGSGTGGIVVRDSGQPAVTGIACFSNFTQTCDHMAGAPSQAVEGAYAKGGILETSAPLAPW